jgi:hypothetical protein
MFITRDLFLRRHDKEGKSYVSEHRVWDPERFVASESAAAKKEGGHVEQITKEQYRKERV